MSKVQVYKRKDGLFDWRVRNEGNGKVEATSGGQAFSERNDAREAAERLFPQLAVEVLEDVVDAG